MVKPKNPDGLNRRLQEGASRRTSWRAHFLLQTGRRQLLEIPEIERVNSFYRTSCRATHQQSVINFRADPSAACHHIQCLQIVFLTKGYHLKMRQNVIGDNARRFNRMYARLDRSLDIWKTEIVLRRSKIFI